MLMQKDKTALPPPGRSSSQVKIRQFSLIGMGIVVFLVVGVGGWMAMAPISGAVIAPGQLEVETSVKAIQHDQGGIVGEILVENGDRVGAGEVLVRLDDTISRASRQIYRAQVDEMLARQARLSAEAAGFDEIAFDPELAERAEVPSVGQLVAREEALFAARGESLENQKGQLEERIKQIEEEITGLTAQANAKQQEVALVRSELEGVSGLYEQGLVPVTRVNTLEREEAGLEGELGQLTAAVARARGRVIEIRLQSSQLDSERRNAALDELANTQAQLAEARERLTAADEQLRRVEIVAPQDGIVHEMQVNTVGGVIGVGETIMQIIPSADALVVDARVSPTDIDQVATDAPVRLQIHAGNQRTVPELDGLIVRVSGDLATDQQTGVSYYRVRASLPEDAQDRLGDLTLLPGMPVTAFIQTQSRTVLEYLLKPLTEQIDRAFRER